jgi:hypothetical protein
MRPLEKRFWLILAVLPFLVPILLFVVRLTAASQSFSSTGKMIVDFIGNFWWLIIIVTVILDSIAFLLHAQHSKVIPDESRQGWTLLILFLGPYAVPFYYWKFIAPLETIDA